MIWIASIWQVYVSAKIACEFHLFGCNQEKYLFGWCHNVTKKSLLCVTAATIFCAGFSLTYDEVAWLSARWQSGQITDQRWRITPRFCTLRQLVWSLLHKKKCSEILHTKNWDYKSLQKSNLIHNLNFYPNSNFQNHNNFSWLHSNKWNSQAIFALT